MSASNKTPKSIRRTLAAFSILVIGLAVSARLIFGGALLRPDSITNADTEVGSTTLTSLEPRDESNDGATTRSIKSIRVGDRVLARNPEIRPEERSTWQEPDWDDWLHLTLEMPLPTKDDDADPVILEIEILRPEQWFIEQVGLVVGEREPGPVVGPGEHLADADQWQSLVPHSPLRDAYRYLGQLNELAASANVEVVGLTVEMDLPEMGAVGIALVKAINPCPSVKSSAGQVVTATFAHPPANQVLDVVFEGESETIGVTDNHLFWSEDRQAFIAIGQMDLGERVVTFHGNTKRIESCLPRPGPQLVYNLEVYGEHVYFVGQQGLLVHNAYSRNDPNRPLTPAETFGIPDTGANAFRKWFDSKSPGELAELFTNSRARDVIKSRLRHGGGDHEWLLVSKAPQVKSWGTSYDDIVSLVTPTKSVKFRDPVTGVLSGHGNSSISSFAHKQLDDLIDSSNSFEQFRRKLNNWAEYSGWLPNGRADLPQGLRL